MNWVKFLKDRLGTPARASISADIVAVEAGIGAIGVASGTGLNYDAETDNVLGAIKTIAFVGVQTSGTYAVTDAEDGVYHVIDDTGDAIDIIYQFDVAGIRKAVQATWHGYVTGANDTITVQAYDYVAAGWDTRATITGQARTTNITKTITLLSRHTGTETDIGKVLIRLVCTGQSNPTLNTDSLLVEAIISQQSVGYADGAVWVKATGNAGTESFVNGTADNPSPWADAETIATNLGLNRFRIIGNETVTLTAATEDKTLIGMNWILALGGQSISNSYFEGAAQVTGTSSGTIAAFKFCTLGSGAAGLTVPPGNYCNCRFDTSTGQALVGSVAGTYVFADCYSAIAAGGLTTPYFTFSGACAVNFRRYSGGANITLDNNASTLTYEVLGGGNLTVAIAGGKAEVRGSPRDMTFTGITSNTTIRFVGVTGPISLAGADGAVSIYGVCGAITDTRTGAPTTTNTAGLDADIAAVKSVVDGLEALLPTKTLSAANDTVAAGYYEATTLSTVDADLATANIKAGVTIFGISGTSTVKDVSDTTSVAGDVAAGTYFYTADGTRTEGTAV